MNLLLLSILTLITSATGVAITRHLAQKKGWTAQPRGDRWHTKPTALHGGIGFYPAFLIGLTATLITHLPHNWLTIATETGWIRESIALGAGALLMFILGWLDDLKQYRPVTKLLVQLIAASLFIATGAVIPVTQIQILDILITYFWFIGIINAVNMLDNMDGLSSGIVFIAAGTIVILTPTKLLAIPIALTLMAALLGFWIYNRPPASIFMGDSGSLFIGYVLASLAIPNELNGYFGIENTFVLALLIPVTILSVPIFDTTLVTITRKWRAQKASQGGRDHSSHRLVLLGFKEKQVMWAFYTIAFFAGLTAVGMQRYIEYSLLLFCGFFIFILLIGVYLVQMTGEIAKNDFVPPSWTHIISHYLHKRYFGVIMLDMILIVLCYYSAYLLRFDGILSSHTFESLNRTIPLIVPSCLLAFVISGIYQIQWHFISISDLTHYILAVAGGVILSLATIVIITRFEDGQSRGAHLIFGLLLFLVLVATRLSFRLFDHLLRHVQTENRKPVLIYGAGKGGKILLEEIYTNPELKTFRVKGFIDDDLRKKGRKLHGRPIKNMTEWTDYIKDMTPEIWLSSKLIPIDKIHEFENKTKTSIFVRRMTVKITTI